MSKSIAKYLLFALVLITLHSGAGFGQTAKPLRFEDFAAKVETPKKKTPNLSSHKEARLFRTNLRRAAKGGVNFAGRYALTYWGCGSGCGVGALVDLRTGRVFFPGPLQGVQGEEWPNTQIPLGFRNNSRLLILNGYEPNNHGNSERYGNHYYVWNGSMLRKIKFVRRSLE